MRIRMYIKIILFILISVNSYNLFSQSKSIYEPKRYENAYFKEGEDSLIRFINKNLVYPDSTELFDEDYISSFQISFMIDTFGKTYNYKVNNGFNSEKLNKTLISKIKKNMPFWIPKKDLNKNRKIKSKYFIPIYINIQ
jgi:hypothetical protein